MQLLSAPLPGETIYSWCATQHASNSNISAARSAAHLLGGSHAMRQHDLPASLGRLPILDRGDESSIINLLRKHTIGAFYWPFLGVPQRHKVIAAISDESDIHWRRTLCASSRSRPTDHPLRWCAQCAFDDAHTEGRAYWHVAHQLPTCYACVTHQTRLHIARSTPKSWQLPPQNGTIDQRPPDATATALLAASLSQSICDLDNIDVSGLRHAALMQLRDMGVIVSLHSVQHDRVFRWFAQTSASAWCQEHAHGLNHLADGHWIPALLWRRRMSHPVLWAVLWLALEWSSPIDACVAFRDAANGQVQLPGGQLSLLAFDEQVMVNAPPNVRGAFMVSQSYGEVMARLQVSRGDVVRWLESDPSLRQEWRQLLREGKQLECESILRAAVLSDIHITRAVLQHKCDAAYRWMREHAPHKLYAMLQSIPARLAVQPTLFD
ncbi:MAG: TniQ family protein [Burkholderiales bacterium]|nr:TniQ family protein [Burkholderiales bacterium]